MKKLNRKGFTLVELLAVIIILAIVVGISIPAVLSTINNSRKKAAVTAAEVAANWVSEQYTILSVDSSAVDSTWKTICGADGSNCYNKTVSAGTNLKSFLTATGMKEADVSAASIKLNSNGKACVQITAKSAGAYYVNSDTTHTFAAGYNVNAAGTACS